MTTNSRVQPSSTVWPRAYILSLYNAALDSGFVWAEGIAEADAVGLRQSFYRFRRRSDTSNHTLITPEMHLVTVGNWEPGPDGKGRIPFLYNRLPDGAALPLIRAATGEEIEQLQRPAAPQPPALAAIPPTPAFDPSSIPAEKLEVNDTDISSFVARMRRSAEEKSSEH